MTKPKFLSLRDSQTLLTFFKKDDFYPGLLLEQENGEHICLLDFLFEVFDDEQETHTYLFFSGIKLDGSKSRFCIQFQKRVSGFSFRDPDASFL